MQPQAIERELRDHHVIGRGHEREPLVDYAVLVTTFLTITGTAVVSALRHGAIPPRVPVQDALLLGLATTRLSRLVTREKVARPIRAPFTDVEDGASLDEVKERPRGDGVTRAIGELLTCPRCFGMWASAGLTIAYVFAPGPTRFVSGILAGSLVSDWINVRFAHARERDHRERDRGERAAGC